MIFLGRSRSLYVTSARVGALSCRPRMRVDGRTVSTAEATMSPELAGLVSYQGPLLGVRYPPVGAPCLDPVEHVVPSRHVHARDVVSPRLERYGEPLLSVRRPSAQCSMGTVKGLGALSAPSTISHTKIRSSLTSCGCACSPTGNAQPLSVSGTHAHAPSCRPFRSTARARALTSLLSFSPSSAAPRGTPSAFS